jgi:hypothetical protein
MKEKDVEELAESAGKLIEKILKLVLETDDTPSPKKKIPIKPINK